jgi:hypothetical protein
LTGFLAARSRQDLLAWFADWLDAEAKVPKEKCFKRFPRMIVCEDGDLVKTFLNAQQVPIGKETF